MNLPMFLSTVISQEGKKKREPQRVSDSEREERGKGRPTDRGEGKGDHTLFARLRRYDDNREPAAVGESFRKIGKEGEGGDEEEDRRNSFSKISARGPPDSSAITNSTQAFVSLCFLPEKRREERGEKRRGGKERTSAAEARQCGSVAASKNLRRVETARSASSGRRGEERGGGRKKGDRTGLRIRRPRGAGLPVGGPLASPSHRGGGEGRKEENRGGERGGGEIVPGRDSKSQAWRLGLAPDVLFSARIVSALGRGKRKAGVGIHGPRGRRCASKSMNGRGRGWGERKKKTEEEERDKTLHPVLDYWRSVGREVLIPTSAGEGGKEGRGRKRVERKTATSGATLLSCFRFSHALPGRGGKGEVSEVETPRLSMWAAHGRRRQTRARGRLCEATHFNCGEKKRRKKKEKKRKERRRGKGKKGVRFFGAATEPHFRALPREGASGETEIRSNIYGEG